MYPTFRLRLCTALIFCMLLGIGLVLHAQKVIGKYTFMYRATDEVPTTSVALVFGAGLKKDGTPSDALTDRVLSAVDIYKAGKVRKLVMTGDNGSKRYDEVTAMKELAVEEGVSEEDIVLDYAGFRTYDSCYRARDVFGLWDVIAVSQEFHLPRILFICNAMRVHAVGYVADRREYLQSRYWPAREFLARLKAWYQIVVTKPLPKFLGKKEKVF